MTRFFAIASPSAPAGTRRRIRTDATVRATIGGITVPFFTASAPAPRVRGQADACP